MSVTEDEVHRLVSMAYDAALDEQKWPAFLDAFAQAMGGVSSLLRFADLQASKAGFVASAGYDPAWQAAYCDHFIKSDYLVPALNQLRVGEVKSSDQILRLSEQRKTEYFNDYSIPQDKVHAIGTILFKEGNNTLTFGVQRGKSAGEFGKEEVGLMNRLAPHVSRAVHVHRKINAITTEKEQVSAAFNQLRMGVILTNRQAVPLYLNRAAELMMSQDVGLALFHGKLALHSPTETAHLHQLIANALHGSGDAVGGDMRITMPNRSGMLHCLVTPVPREYSFMLNAQIESDCVALFLSRPGHLQLSPKRLVTLYKITPAEARLTARLAALRTVEEAADDLGIAVSTVRSQLKSVFAKTGTNSQSELLMLLATGTLAYCNDP